MKVSQLSLGAQIRKMREEAELNQSDLAKKAHVSREWLSSVENGKSTVDFAKVLDVVFALGYKLELEKQKLEK